MKNQNISAILKTVIFIIGCVALSCKVQPKNQTSSAIQQPTNVDSKCEKTVVVDEKQYQSGVSNKFALLDAQINENCLSVKINYAGGCGDVSLNLVDANIIMESEPVQRKIKLLFKDKDDCEALVTKDFTFNISSLKINSKNKIMLHLDGWEGPIIY